MTDLRFDLEEKSLAVIKMLAERIFLLTHRSNHLPRTLLRQIKALDQTQVLHSTRKQQLARRPKHLMPWFMQVFHMRK